MVPKRYLIWKMRLALSFHWSCVCADLSGISGLGSGHHHKVSIVIKRVVILLLVEGLDFNLQKTQHLWRKIKQSTIKLGMPIFKCEPKKSIGNEDPFSPGLRVGYAGQVRRCVSTLWNLSTAVLTGLWKGRCCLL